MSDQRNMIVFILLSASILLVWMYLFPAPRQEPVPEENGKQVETTNGAMGPAGALPQMGGVSALPRDAALAQVKRVPIEAPSVSGSLSLTGARIDDLQLNKYQITPKDGGCKNPESLAREQNKRDFDASMYSPETCQIVLLNPLSASNAYYADFGLARPGRQRAENSGPGLSLAG